MSRFVRQRRALALDLLLLAHTVLPLSDDGLVRAPASGWARALGIPDRPGNRALISRSWSWLAEQDLIRSSTEGRLRVIEVLCEDGSGRAYDHAANEDAPYFKLPVDYWRAALPSRLSLPAKAVLLIGLSLQGRNEEFFELPLERGAGWYGLTAESLGIGLRELRAQKIVRTWKERRDSDSSPLGYAFDRRHSLNPLAQVAWRHNEAPETD